jgi:hypothetical protein
MNKASSCRIWGFHGGGITSQKTPFFKLPLIWIYRYIYLSKTFHSIQAQLTWAHPNNYSHLSRMFPCQLQFLVADVLVKCILSILSLVYRAVYLLSSSASNPFDAQTFCLCYNFATELLCGLASCKQPHKCNVHVLPVCDAMQSGTNQLILVDIVTNIVTDV